MAEGGARRKGGRVGPVRIGIFGAGSIGCFVGGRLRAAGEAVTFVGRERLRAQIEAHGLTVADFGERLSLAADEVRYGIDPEALAECEAVLVCVKSAQTAEVAARLDALLGPAVVVASLQNGVRNAETLRGALGARPVVATIVEFNVVSKGEGVFQRGTDGGLVVERVRGAEALTAALRRSGLGVKVVDDIRKEQWTKLLVNLNNAVVALTDLPTPVLMSDGTLRRVIAAIIEEAAGVLGAAGIEPARLRGLPVSWMPRILRLPDAVARLILRAQMKADPDARSSMWEDLHRGRRTEVDYLNGEILRVAERAGVAAPVNEAIVRLVRDAEAAGQGSPGMSPAALAAALGVS